MPKRKQVWEAPAVAKALSKVTMKTTPQDLLDGKPAVRVVTATKWHVKIVDGWLPLPEEAIRILGWHDGDDIEIVPIDDGKQLVVRRKETLQ